MCPRICHNELKLHTDTRYRQQTQNPNLQVCSFYVEVCFNHLTLLNSMSNPSLPSWQTNPFALRRNLKPRL
jgi:uncharacterized CHY-type Zn-finger protein